MHIRSLLISCLSSLSWGVVATVSAVFYLPMLATEAIASMRWDWPADARTSLAADAIARRETAVIEADRSMFRSFHERALSHDLFVGGRFDPGRAAA